MAGSSLVIAHPPHGAVDVQLAAHVLGIAPVDVRLKVNYPIPEIWLALDDPAAVRGAVEALRGAGMTVVVVSGMELAAVPPHRPTASFDFGETGLRLQDDGGADTLSYDTPVVAVLFTPRMAEAKGPQLPSFLDLYVTASGGPARWTVLQGVTGFGGMGRRQTASFGTNVHAFAAEVEARFPNGVLDRRLEHMRTRRRGGVPPPGVLRHGHSFATAQLNQLLEAIRPGLSEIEDDDFSSRLAYLTHAAG
jgi:hypothetical protein